MVIVSLMLGEELFDYGCSIGSSSGTKGRVQLNDKGAAQPRRQWLLA
jgi:hypothetical protein